MLRIAQFGTQLFVPLAIYGGVVQVDPRLNRVDRAWFQRSRLKHDEPL
jgi:hypothetical protein